MADPLKLGDRFDWGPGDVVLPQCVLCAHAARDDSPVPYCVAFPGRIPPEIRRNLVDHRRPYLDPETGAPADAGVAGARSITFEPDPDAAPEALAALHRHLDSLHAP